MAQQDTDDGADLDDQGKALLAAAATLETDVSGWEVIDQCGAALANWVDDRDNPIFGVSVMSTSKSIPPEGEDEIQSREGAYGVRRMTRYRTVSGYQLIAGPTRTDGTEYTVIDEWYGTPEQTPRETEHDLLLDVLQRARMWLRAHIPRQKRLSACMDGYGPDPLPEAELEAEQGQGTLDSFGDRLGA